MPLIERFKNSDTTTQFRSLKYGNDRPNEGNSGQPYITTPLPVEDNNVGTSTDFLLRGGNKATQNSGTDVVRLGKMFGDLRSPKGLLFIAKQNLLSRTAVRTQTSGILNEGIYTPLSTLAQAGIVAFGGHLRKQGLNPFIETGAYANNDSLYFNKVNELEKEEKNRLVEIYTEKQTAKTINNNVLSYPGGPGSILGIGNTNIRFADQRTGKQNKYFDTPWFNGKSIKTTIITPYRYLNSINTSQTGPLLENKGVSGKYFKLTGVKVINDDLWKTNAQNSVYTQGNTFPDVNKDIIYANNSFTYDQKELINPYFKDIPFISNNNSEVNSKASPKIQDFRELLRRSDQPQKQTAIKNGSLAYAPNYNGSKAYESRVNIGGKDGKGPGNFGSKDLSSHTYVSGVGPIDKINALTNLDKDIANDLVKFRIAIIDNKTPSSMKYLHFRAFLDSMSDSFTADWNGFNYLGRNEKFYTYSGYSRQISLSWTVAAQSKEELIPMYKKLNYLGSSLTGDYSKNGYMMGNIAKLTVGGYLYEQPGIITSLTYDVPTESPWEIGINTQGDNDSTVKELPHIIRVTGFNFIPIQTFLPQIQDKINGGKRYISLSNGKNNYDEEFKDFNGSDLI
jgi:hypothetical protein